MLKSQESTTATSDTWIYWEFQQRKSLNAFKLLLFENLIKKQQDWQRVSLIRGQCRAGLNQAWPIKKAELGTPRLQLLDTHTVTPKGHAEWNMIGLCTVIIVFCTTAKKACQTQTATEIVKGVWIEGDSERERAGSGCGQASHLHHQQTHQRPLSGTLFDRSQ